MRAHVAAGTVGAAGPRCPMADTHYLMLTKDAGSRHHGLKSVDFLRHLGYDTESQRVRNGCYLIFSTDSLKWQKKTYLTFVLCWPGVIFHTRKQEGCPPALVQCPIWHSCLGDAVCHLCFLACIPRTCQSRPELYSKENLIIIIEKETYLADVFCITRFLKNAKFSD